MQRFREAFSQAPRWAARRSISRRGTRRIVSLTAVAVMALLASLGPVQSASAAEDPNNTLSFTLEGCRNPADTLPNAKGDFVCADGEYTSGNLGKTWNELDLVPYRLTAKAKNASDNPPPYAIAIVADHRNSGRPGYDVISVPEVNKRKSHNSCTVTASPTAAENAAGAVLAPGIGGTDESIYRILTITQNKNTTCVFDYYERLALDSSLYPGSSLHSNLTNQSFGTAGIGARDVSIPVKEILPQELRKDMAATQDSEHLWTVTKSAAPANLDFADTCLSPAARASQVEITIEWTKAAPTPSGDVEVTTDIYAKNPAHRTITVDVTDVIYSGTTVLDTVSTPLGVDVPAETELKVLTHTFSVAAAQAVDLSDVATATYTDKVTGVLVPGSETATASAVVQASGIVKDATVTITDVESIAGDHLSFSADSATLGGFLNGYAGATTAGPVNWSSGAQTGSGSVTFTKTVSVDEPAITSGTLTDTATLTGSDGFTATDDLDVDVTTDAKVSLTIDKTIPNILSGTETAKFTFRVTGPGGYSNAVDIDFAAGDTNKTALLTGLAPGRYIVSENLAAGFLPQTNRIVDIDLPDCSGQATFVNTFGPATAEVQKVTVPAGEEAGWEFTLTGPGTPPAGETATTTGSGAVGFLTALEEGDYTITESPRAGWDFTSTAGDCTFTVDYPADADRAFSCTFTNTKRGEIVVEKLTDPAGSTAAFDFTGDLTASLSDGQTASASVAPGTYGVSETIPAGWDLTSIVCDDSDSSGSVATATAAFVVAAGERVKCTFTNTEQGRVTVVKTENGQVPAGAWTFTLAGGPDAVDLTLTTDAANQGSLDFGSLKPGTYTLCEVNVPAGAHSSLQDVAGATVDPLTGDVCLTFTLGAGEQRELRIDNTLPGGDPRTIGYWKNHASCSNVQKGQLLDDYLPILLGDVSVATCRLGVDILDNASSTWAEHMLAAQLLAAKLNVAAGASRCSAATGAIAKGDDLLKQIKWDGTQTTKIVRSKHPLRSEFVHTATLLDTYNNGKLC